VERILIMATHTKGGMTFQNREKLVNYIRFILYNTPEHEPLTGKWFDVMDDVLKGHQNYSQKVGKGKYGISVQVCPVNPENRCFIVMRDSGEITDFSFYKALTSRSYSSEVKAALRNVVKEQAIQYKKEYFAENAVGKYCVCPSTGLKITVKTSHLDHYPKQFDEIVADWLKLNKLKISNIKLEDSKDNQVSKELLDIKLSLSFFEYHLKTAEYRVVLSQVNLQRKRAKVDWE
jgi:hypothetical protein